MVQVSEGGEPQKVPLVYYDEEGERHVVGEAAVQIQHGEVIALGKITDKVRFNETSGISIGGLGIEAFSMDFGPTPVEEASARLGILRKGLSQHVTQRNPSGEVKTCERAYLHGPHEWHVHPADFFAVYCPGKSVK